MAREQQRRLPTLGVFIEQAIARGFKFPCNSWVTAHGFSSLYVRVTRRAIKGDIYEPVLDLATMEARKPGSGTFTRLVEKLRTEYPELHLYVEQTHERFGAYLMKLGFEKLDPVVHGESYFLVSANVERQLKEACKTLDKASELIDDTNKKLDDINKIMKEGI